MSQGKGDVGAAPGNKAKKKNKTLKLHWFVPELRSNYRIFPSFCSVYSIFPICSKYMLIYLMLIVKMYICSGKTTRTVQSRNESSPELLQHEIWRITVLTPALSTALVSLSLSVLLPAPRGLRLPPGRPFPMTFGFLAGPAQPPERRARRGPLSAPLAPSRGCSGHCMPPKGGLTSGEQTPGGWWTGRAPSSNCKDASGEQCGSPDKCQVSSDSFSIFRSLSFSKASQGVSKMPCLIEISSKSRTQMF